jgi:hypothetical protein
LRWISKITQEFKKNVEITKEAFDRNGCSLKKSVPKVGNMVLISDNSSFVLKKYLSSKLCKKKTVQQ